MFGTETTTLTIEGMTCGNCVAHATKALSAVKDVKKVTVDLASKKAEVKHKGVSTDALREAIVAAGYEPSHDE